MKIQRFEFNLFGENTYIVWDEASGEAAIVDPGMQNTNEQQVLQKFIESHGLKVMHLLNTHLHIDHTLGNDYVSEKYNVVTAAHPADAPLGMARDAQAKMFHLSIPSPVALPIAIELSDGSELNLGTERLTVIATPGHSQGSICFYAPKSSFVITGDTLFQNSIGRTDLPGGNYDTLIHSIQEQLFALPDDTVVYPGHGASTTIGYEKRHNPFL